MRVYTRRIALCHPERPHKAKGMCKSCYKKSNPERNRLNASEWAKRNPIKIKEHNLRYAYGIGVADVDRILSEQNNSCPLCLTPLGAHDGHVDHCHKSGKVRGVLCMRCNLMLGNAKESEATLSRAIQYLKTGGMNTKVEHGHRLQSI